VTPAFDHFEGMTEEQIAIVMRSGGNYLEDDLRILEPYFTAQQEKLRVPGCA